MSLKSCIKKSGAALSSADIETIQLAYDAYVTEGSSPRESAEDAVQDLLDELADTRAEIVKKIEAKGGVVSGEPVKTVKTFESEAPEHAVVEARPLDLSRKYNFFVFDDAHQDGALIDEDRFKFISVADFKKAKDEFADLFTAPDKLVSKKKPSKPGDTLFAPEPAEVKPGVWELRPTDDVLALVTNKPEYKKPRGGERVSITKVDDFNYEVEANYNHVYSQSSVTNGQMIVYEVLKEQETRTEEEQAIVDQTAAALSDSRSKKPNKKGLVRTNKKDSTPADAFKSAVDAAKGLWLEIQANTQFYDKVIEHAIDQREAHRQENSQKVILSLFDLTGKWSQPWADAGYNVIQVDLQSGIDIFDITPEYLSEELGVEGDIYGVLAAVPCTDFTYAGARHFDAKDKDGRTERSKDLVFQTMDIVERLRPKVWVVENPLGRIEKLTGLPGARMAFQPSVFGQPYTKLTYLWGKFNTNLPEFPVDPVLASKMHKQFGGKSIETKNARSETPIGFAASFFMANNYVDMSVEDRLALDFPAIDGAVKEALKAGLTEEDIRGVVEDIWDGTYDASNDEARTALAEATEEMLGGTFEPRERAESYSDDEYDEDQDYGDEPGEDDFDAYDHDLDLDSADNQATKVSMTVKAVEAAIADVRKNLRADFDIVVLQSERDMPENLQKAKVPGRVRRGRYAGGKVYLFANAIGSARQAQTIIAHELVGHKGVIEMAGKEGWQEIRTGIADLRKSGNSVAKSIWNEVSERYSGASEDTKYYEFMALAAERRVNRGPVGQLVARLKQFIREFLKASGFKGLFAESEIDSILANAEKYLAARKGVPGLKWSSGLVLDSATGEARLKPIPLELEGWEGGSSELSRLARDVYKNELQGTTVHNASLDADITFSSEGRGEAFGARGKMRTPIRAELVKVLRQVVQDAIKVGETAPDQRRARNSKAFHTLLAPILVQGKIHSVKVTVREALDPGSLPPHKFYDVTAVEIERGANVHGFKSDESPSRPAPVSAPDISLSELAAPFNLSLDSQDADDVMIDKLGLGGREKSSKVLKIIKDFKEAGWKDYLQTIGTKINDAAFDGLAAIKRAEDSVRKGIAAGDYAGSGYVGARLATGIADLMHGILHYGAPKWAGGVATHKKGTKGLLEVFQELGDDANDFLGWMAGNRGQQLIDDGREENLTQADVDKLKALSAGKEEKFERAKKAYNELNSSMLDFAEESGTIDPAARKEWESEWYVPFYRFSEADGESAMLSPSTKRGLSHQSAGIKRLTGSKLPTSDLMENIIANWLKIADSSMKNMALKKTVDNLKDSEYLTDETIKWQQVTVRKQDIAKKIRNDRKLMAEVAKFLGMKDHAKLAEVHAELNKIDDHGFEKMWGPTAPTDPDVIRIKRDGKNEYYRVNDPSLLKSIVHLSDTGFRDPFTKAARWFKGVLTTGVTASPDFILRNFVRDAAHAWAINPDGFTFGKDSLKGLKGAFAEDEDYRALMFAGASFQGGYVHGTDPEASAQIIRRALRSKGLSRDQIDSHMKTVLNTSEKMKAAIEKGWEMYRNVGDKVENANRLATFRNARTSGKDLAQAAYEAKDLMDYSLKGNMQAFMWLVDVVPFLNARLQGASKIARATKADKAAVGLAIAKIAMFSVALAALNDDDERYQELPDWEKDAYWHIFAGDEHWRLPKPFEIGIIAGSIPERMWNTWVAETQPDEKLLWSVKHGIYETMNINPLPQLLIPLVEAWGNRSFYFDTPIEGMGDENKLPEDRYNAYTSSTMVSLGQLMGVSPKKLQHVWEGYTGTMGAYALSAADIMTRAATTGDIPRPSIGVEDLPAVKSFYRGDDPARSTQYTTEFYDRMTEVNQIYASMRDRMKDDPESSRELLEENADKLKFRKAINRASKRLSDLRKNRDAIMSDPNMSSREKKMRIDDINAMLNQITEQSTTMTEDAF